jgi:hypothetical protein
MFETTAALQARAAALANKRIDVLKGSVSALTVAGRELNKVARRHILRFVKENSSLAIDAGKDVSALARTTFATLAKRPAAPKPKARKTSAARKRVAAKAA